MRRSCLIALAFIVLAPATYANSETGQSETCGYLPYRPGGKDRFGPSREQALPAKIGGQASYALALDLLRPTFLAAEIADDLLMGKTKDEIRDTAGSALSLGEYMLFSAKQFAEPPKETENADFRRRLAEARAQTFHAIYMLSKTNYETIASNVRSEDSPNKDALMKVSKAWRPAYALLAKTQADDKRIELLASDLDMDSVLEKEAEVCLVHAVHVIALDQSDSINQAHASIKRWDARPLVNARALPKAARAPFFDREDVGDELAAKILSLEPGSINLNQFKAISELYAQFVDASKVLHNAMLEKNKPQ